MSGLSVAQHRFTAKGLYGEQPVSAERVVSVLPLKQCVDFNTLPVGTLYPDQQTTPIANIVKINPQVLGNASLYPIRPGVYVYKGMRTIQARLHASAGTGGPQAQIIYFTASDTTQKVKVTFDVTEGTIVTVSTSGVIRIGVGTGHVVESTSGGNVQLANNPNNGDRTGVVVITGICVGG
ncbi:hypothetical protein D3C78_1312030 [compost metagenome]